MTVAPSLLNHFATNPTVRYAIVPLIENQPVMTVPILATLNQEQLKQTGIESLFGMQPIYFSR